MPIGLRLALGLGTAGLLLVFGLALRVEAPVFGSVVIGLGLFRFVAWIGELRRALRRASRRRREAEEATEAEKVWDEMVAEEGEGGPTAPLLLLSAVLIGGLGASCGSAVGGGGPPPSGDDDSGGSAGDDDDSGGSAGDDDDSGGTAGDDDDSAEETPNAAERLKDSMLVLYNAEEEASLEVAEYYVAQRGLPPDSLCPTWPGDLSEISIEDYQEGVAGPVIDCIDGAWDATLVLVTTWGLPYKVLSAVLDIGPSTDYWHASLDALLTYPHHNDDLPLAATYSPYARSSTSSTGEYEAGQGFGDWREETGTVYYLVGRIDGATAAEAMALIDRALDGEERAAAGELVGTSYVDSGHSEETEDTFGTYGSVEHDLERLEEVFEEAGFPPVRDDSSAEFGTEPAPLSCPNALYYGGWYSFNNYNDVFTWQPGAVGFHFDSCSACNPRGGENWSANALSRGITATMGAINEPYVAGLMGYDQFFLYFFQGYTFIEAGAMATPITEWMATYLGDPLYCPYCNDPLLDAGWRPGVR